MHKNGGKAKANPFTFCRQNVKGYPQGRRSRGGCGGCNTSPIIQTLVKVGQNGTDICLKLKVKIGKMWSKFGIKDGRSCSKL
jgi:hypothetical protein